MPISSQPPPLPWDYIAKLICIGDSGTGKSSLTIRLCEGRFVSSHDVTIGVEFGSRIVPVGQSKESGSLSAQTDGHAPPSAQQKLMKLSIWDSAGQETYRSITRSYFRGASGALLVFDITRRATFEHATAWLNDLRQIAEDNIVVVLVGNKCDLAASDSPNAPQRAVSVEEAEAWCKQEGVLRYVETSAKNGDGVENAFLDVAERIYQNIEAGKYDLNDRRSGVKGYGTGPGGGRDARRNNAQRTVTLGMNDAMKGQRGAGGGCC